jgi:hypothetical protein
MLRRHFAYYTLTVLVVGLAFCFYRSSVGFVWDDSPRLVANLYDSDNPVCLGRTGWFSRILVHSFGTVTRSGYRPLTAFYNLLGISIFSNPNASPHLWFLFVGLILGLLSISVYLVSRRYLETKLGAILAVFLFVFSAPVVTGSWIVLAGTQALVPFLVCAGLLLYWKTVESDAHNCFYQIVLCILFLLGPWFREFIGFLPLLVIFLEMKRARRPTVLTGIAFLFFLHALFPTVLMRLFVFKSLPCKSIFSLGSLGDQVRPVGNGDIAFFARNLLSSIRWQVPRHFLTLFPPIIVGLVLIDYILLAFRGCCAAISEAVEIRSLFVLHTFSKGWGATLKNLYLPFSFTVVFILGITHAYQSHLFYLLLCLVFPLQGLRKDSFLSLWFFLFFLPFLWVFTEQVHLAYSLLPTAIITSVVLEDIYQRLYQCMRAPAFIRHVFSFLIVIGISDHSLNLYGSYKVVNGISDGIHSVSDWVKKNIRENSIIVTNVIHLEDVRLYTNGWVGIFYTVAAGIARPETSSIIDANGLQELLEQNYETHDIYFVDVDFNYTPDKVGYHCHKYVRNNSVPMEDLGPIHITRVRYPYVDPFKAYIARPYISFLGPPDLENDFYRGPAQDGRAFMREVYAEYHVCRVTGTEVDRWVAEGSLKLIDTGYRGFNVLSLNGRFFAIPQGEGEFDLKKIWQGEYSNSFVSSSYDEVLRQIDSWAGTK